MWVVCARARAKFFFKKMKILAPPLHLRGRARRNIYIHHCKCVCNTTHMPKYVEEKEQQKCCNFCVGLTLFVILILELIFGAIARLTAFESVLASVNDGEICLPAETTWSWRREESRNGAFSRTLTGRQAGVEDLYGLFAPSALALVVRVWDRGLYLDSSKAMESFKKLQSSKEFASLDGGIWTWILKVMEKCNGAYSTGPILYTSLANASDTLVNREIETKENGIPDFIWKNKVLLPENYSCQVFYKNKPLTLLNFDDSQNRCLRDKYKIAYMEGFYDVSSSDLAKQINDVVMNQLTAYDMMFDESLPNCPGTLSGVLCPLWLGYMNATLLTHAGSDWVSGREVELTKAMSDWLYEGFHKDLFSLDDDQSKTTLKSAETLLCFYAQASRYAYEAKDVTSAQYRWIRAVEKMNDTQLSQVFDHDAAATESLHNSLALGFQGATASTWALLDLWREQHKGTIQPGDLAKNATLRRQFLRESLRRSSPGVPTMFASSFSGNHKMLKGDGEKQINFKGGPDGVNLIAHSIPARHKLYHENPNEFNMNREAFSCPFAKRAKYNKLLSKGGCSKEINDGAFASTNPSVFQNNETYYGCRSFNEQNIHLVNSSAEYDLSNWIMSSSHFIPFGVGYRRCPGGHHHHYPPLPPPKTYFLFSLESRRNSHVDNT